MLLASIALREFKLDRLSLSARYGYHKKMPIGKSECVLDRVRKSRADIGLHHKTVDDYLNIVLFVLIKRDLLGKIVDASVNSCTNVSALLCGCKNLFVHTLLRSDHGC